MSVRVVEADVNTRALTRSIRWPTLPYEYKEKL